MKKSAKYYHENPDALEHKREYQRKYNKRADQVDKRVELTRENRRRGTMGDKIGPRAGKDLSHHKSGRFTYQSPSDNRGSNDAMPGDERARGRFAGKRK